MVAFFTVTTLVGITCGWVGWALKLPVWISALTAMVITTMLGGILL